MPTNSHMPKFIFSWLILIIFLAFHCAPKPKILPEERTPQNVLKCALRNEIKFESFASIMNLKLKGEEAKFSSTVEFFYKSPDLFSFYPRSFWGGNIFKAKGEGDSLTLYFPNNSEYYKGDFSGFEKSALWGLKIEIRTLLKIITGENGLSEKEALYTGQDKNNFIYKSEDEKWIRQYWIDFKKCRLTKSLWTDKSRGGAYQIEYKNFVPFENSELAKIVEIKSSPKESAKIKFIEWKFNFPIPEKKFQIEIPPGAKKITFEPKPE